jgi:DNA-binding HxlR family transcriptional regulator
LRRRELDGCPITNALQIVGDKWTLLVARELAAGPRRTMELLNALYPMSSRTLVARLRDMENDQFVTRTDFGGNPPHIEYELTERGRLLLPLGEAFRKLAQALGCGECEERRERAGDYCNICPKNPTYAPDESFAREPVSQPHRYRRPNDDSIVLL